MDFSQLIWAIGSLIVGVLATIWVSRHYYNRSVDKALTPYVHYFSSLFNGVDPSVRESLKVAYKGTAVEELIDIQFLIANTGQKAIRDVISPLTLKMPGACVLLDASILHVSPQGREVVVEQSESAAQFKFPLLNPEEFFITKLLVKGAAKLANFEFSITVDDLPPTLQCTRLSPGLLEGDGPRKFDKELLIVGGILFISSLAIATLVYFNWGQVRYLKPTELFSASPVQVAAAIATLASGLISTILFVVSAMMATDASGKLNFARRKRFQVPSRFHPARLRIEPTSFRLDEIEGE